MITTAQEKELTHGLHLLRLAKQGDAGEQNNAIRKLKQFIADKNISVEQLNGFDKKTASGFRLEYEDKVFYNTDDLLAWMKQQSVKAQLRALFLISWKVIHNRFTTPDNKNIILKSKTR